MREILFRGKRLDTGEWVESMSLARCIGEQPEDVTYYIGSRQPALMGFNEQGDILLAETHGDCLFYKIDPETIGQFTGLTDKNGKRIFEGDILDVNGYAYACRWDEGNVEFGLYNKYESIGIAYIGAFNSEVIGNIHDNPELLDGERRTDG